jgi:leucyl aminopeptidase
VTTSLSFRVSAVMPDDVPVTGRLVDADLTPYGEGAVPAAAAALRGFHGKVGETLVLPAGKGVEILVGGGDRASFGPTEARRAAATLARALGAATAAAVDVRGVASGGLSVRQLVQVVVEGVAGAAYRFERYRSERTEDALERLVLVVGEDDLEEAGAGLERGRAVAEAVAFARDLANAAPGDLTPRSLAEQVTALSEASGTAIVVLDEEQIAEERLGGLLGVARGSAEPPRLVKLTYEPDEAVAQHGPDGRVPTVVLVGKGITFDSGGLSLKPPDAMIGMKGDMSGAAIVLATVSACRGVGVGVRVIAIAPVTENMPGSRAIKPGDVLTIRNGRTIEVLNTDAEGRLVLADGLVLATEHDPDAVIDVATLTGACVVALGNRVAGLMGNDSGVVGAIEEASERAGEAFWRLPLPRDYRKDIDSDIADMKNIGKPRQAGALVAGLLLEEFVADRPWAHLDIAGPADSEEERYEVRKGGTGFGIRTLLEFLQAFSASDTRLADHARVG